MRKVGAWGLRRPRALTTMFSLFWRRHPPKRETGDLCEKGAYCELVSSLSPHPLKEGVPTALQDANRAAPVRLYHKKLARGATAKGD